MCTQDDHPDIIIEDSGVSNIKAGSLGIVFYLTVINTGRQTYQLTAKVEKCCELRTDDDMDCLHMHLLGGHIGPIEYNDVMNVTLIYPNLYPQDRQGRCDVALMYSSHSRSGTLRNSISFNTTVSPGQPERGENAACTSPDEDPMLACAPMDCTIKYGGLRNYYSTTLRKCVGVPRCGGPDQVYDPVTNTCMDMKARLTPDDLYMLSSGNMDLMVGDVTGKPTIPNIRCHNGRVDNTSGLCVCAPGWLTVPFLHDSPDLGTSVYHMCVSGNGRRAMDQPGDVPLLFTIIVFVSIMFLTFIGGLLYSSVYCMDPETIWLLARDGPDTYCLCYGEYPEEDVCLTEEEEEGEEGRVPSI